MCQRDKSGKKHMMKIWTMNCKINPPVMDKDSDNRGIILYAARALQKSVHARCILKICHKYPRF